MVRYYSYYSNAARGKRKLPQRAHAPPIDDFPAYDETLTNSISIDFIQENVTLAKRMRTRELVYAFSVINI